MAEGHDGVLPEFFGLSAVTDTARAAVAQFGADLKATAARDVTRCEAAGAAHVKESFGAWDARVTAGGAPNEAGRPTA